MKIITTVHKAGYEQYGHRWVESMPNWPGANFTMYAEGFDPTGVPFVRTEAMDRLDTFKRRHRDYSPPSWRHDVVRFSNKVFAAHHAFYDHDGIGVWLDADCVTFNPVPPGYVEEQLGDAYMATFQRPGHYTETGLWLMNCAHPRHREFMDLWLRWFEEDAFVNMPEWHDCTTLDATIKMTGLPVRNLSGTHGTKMHPLAYADFGRYVDHCKGARKAAGVSPESQFR